MNFLKMLDDLENEGRFVSLRLLAEFQDELSPIKPEEVLSFALLQRVGYRIAQQIKITKPLKYLDKQFLDAFKNLESFEKARGISKVGLYYRDLWLNASRNSE